MSTLVSRYEKQISGTLSCLDRIVLTGTVPGICHSQGMALYLHKHQILLKDYARFAEPLRDELRGHIEQIARQEQIEIEFIRSSTAFRKEARIQKILQERSTDHVARPASGIVHIFSAMEGCSTFRYHYDKTTGRNTLRGDTGKCLNYYVYLLHPVFGLCYLRIPTWAPFRLQFYCNGHNWLANQLRREGIAFEQLDNTFAKIADWQRAQQIADAFPIEQLHRELDALVARLCPFITQFESTYHWSLMQVEYSSDIVFKKQEDLAPLYDALVHTAIHAVKPDNVATFLGRKLNGNYQDELGNDFHTRIEGTRIKHHTDGRLAAGMGAASLKMYDKQGLVLRIETTVNDVSFFQHYRTETRCCVLVVEHRDGTNEQKVAPMKKTIYSLGALQEIMHASNRRYLSFLSELADPTVGMQRVEQLGANVEHNQRNYRGFNLFAHEDVKLFRTLLRGEVALGTLKNAYLRKHLPGTSGAQASRILKRLHLHGLLKKVGRTYRYHLTDLGRSVATAALKLRELVVIPSLANLIPA
jgi:hypothetical protein